MLAGMQQMMQRMMSGMIKPEGLPGMMQTMRDSMFKEMTTKDRIEFMQDGMPRCMSLTFSKLEPEARSSLASAVLERIVEVWRSQIHDDKEANQT
jgi:hypothetical protein